MDENEVQTLLEKTDAVLHGHFLLTSGLHSPMYVEKFNVLRNPVYTEKLCKEIAARFINDNVQLVVGPMTGGILLSYEVAKNLGTMSMFTERVDGKMTFKRGFSFAPGTRILVVEDIVTTGGSVEEVINAIKDLKGEVVGVGLLVDRSGGKVNFGVRTEALLHLNVETYKPEECPLCAQHVPMTQRGRTGK